MELYIIPCRRWCATLHTFCYFLVQDILSSLFLSKNTKIYNIVNYVVRGRFRGDHGLGRLVEFRFKVPSGTTSSSITTHTPSGQRNCTSWASQPQKSVTLLPCPGGRITKSTKGHMVAFKKKMGLTLTNICT